MMRIFGSTAKDVMLTKLNIRRVFIAKVIRNFSTTSITCQDHKLPPRKLRIKQEKNRQIEQKHNIPNDYDNLGQRQGSIFKTVFILICGILFNPISILAYTSFIDGTGDKPPPTPESERKN